MVFKIKGGTATTLKDFKEANKNKGGGGGGARFVTRIPAEGQILTVRFLTPVEGHWVWYDQVWDQGIGRYVIITEDNAEQYEDYDKSRRWLAPALDVSENRVIAVELPKGLAADIQEHASNTKTGGITGGDYELTKTGTKKDTRYHFGWFGRSELDLSKYDPPSVEALWKIVENMVEGTGAGESANEADIDNATDDDDESEVVEKPATAPKKIVLNRKKA